MDEEQGRYNIDELADLGGVSRRTVRYYVQEGLLPAPLGVGRGRHYDQSHLDRLLEVKAQQEAGRSLDDIRARRTPRRRRRPSRRPVRRSPSRAAPGAGSSSRPASNCTWRTTSGCRPRAGWTNSWSGAAGTSPATRKARS